MNFDLRTKTAPTSRSRTALPLGQLGHCLRLPSGRGPQNFEERKGSKKKKNLVSKEIPKNLIHPCDQKTKILEYFCKHW